MIFLKYNEIKQAADYISNAITIIPEIAVVLGSGLGGFTDVIEDKVEVSYKDIPNFPVSSAKGHDGKIVAGKINGKFILVFSGRIHYYEGYYMDKVALPSLVAKLLGCNKMIITNAAGGINDDFLPGDLMLIKDHIKLCAENPLIGNESSELGTTFIDMTNAYSKDFREVAKDVAYGLGLNLHEGVYAYMSGPCYETPAEIKMLKTLGADAVGMSTVPEVIMARYCGLDVLGISCITNLAAGISKTKLTHEEVLETGERINDTFISLISNIIDRI